MTATEQTRLWKVLESRVDRDLDDWERSLYESEKRDMLKSLWREKEYKKLIQELEQYKEEHDDAIHLKLDNIVHIGLRKYNRSCYPDLEIGELIQRIIEQHLKLADSTPELYIPKGKKELRKNEKI